MARLRPDRPPGPNIGLPPMQPAAPDLDEPAALYSELIPGDGEVLGVICADCRTLREQRAIRAEKACVYPATSVSSWKLDSSVQTTGH